MFERGRSRQKEEIDRQTLKEKSVARGKLRMSDSGLGRQAELRAERIRWTARSRSMNQSSRSLGARLGRMKERASALDGRLRHHREEMSSWHRKWDDLPRYGQHGSGPCPPRSLRSALAKRGIATNEGRPTRSRAVGRRPAGATPPGPRRARRLRGGRRRVPAAPAGRSRPTRSPC